MFVLFILLVPCLLKREIIFHMIVMVAVYIFIPIGNQTLCCVTDVKSEVTSAAPPVTPSALSAPSTPSAPSASDQPATLILPSGESIIGFMSSCQHSIPLPTGGDLNAVVFYIDLILISVFY